MRSKRIYIIFAFLVSLFVAPQSLEAQTLRRDSSDFELGRSIEILANIMREFDENYVNSVSVDDLLSAAVNGVVSATDPYSLYLSEEDMVAFDIMSPGQYGGVGSSIRKQGDYIIFDVFYHFVPHM